MPVDDDQAALRAAIEEARKAAKMSQKDFGAAVAREENQASPYSQQTVAGWFSKPVGFTPHRVFAIERAVGAEPGSLSKIEGYVPVGATPTVTVEEAIAADEDISEEQAAMLLAAVRAARESSRSRPRKRSR